MTSCFDSQTPRVAAITVVCSDAASQAEVCARFTTPTSITCSICAQPRVQNARSAPLLPRLSRLCASAVTTWEGNMPYFVLLIACGYAGFATTALTGVLAMSGVFGSGIAG